MASTRLTKAQWDLIIGPTSQVLRDPVTGAPYDLNARGERIYTSPLAFGRTPATAPPADTTGIFRSRPRWNTKKGEWETPMDWGNVWSLVAGGGLAAGGGAAIAGGAGGGGGAPVLPSTPLAQGFSTLPAVTPSIGAGGTTALLGGGAAGTAAAVGPLATSAIRSEE